MNNDFICSFCTKPQQMCVNQRQSATINRLNKTRICPIKGAKLFDYTKPDRPGQGMWKIKEMMKCFLAPAFLPPGWSPLPACSDDTLLTPQRSSSQFDHASNIPSLKSNTPRPVSQDNIVVPYKLIDSAPLMVTWVTPEEVVRTGGGRLLTTKPLMRPLPPH